MRNKIGTWKYIQDIIIYKFYNKVLMGFNHGLESDFYGLGVILFEMITGTVELNKNIMVNKINI